MEGFADVIRLHQIGIQNSVATCGTALSQNQIEELKKLTTTITLIGDSDPNGAGQKASMVSARNIIQAGIHCKIINLPEGEAKQDPDSYFRTNNFVEYEKLHKQDYIFALAESQKDNHKEPEKAKLISDITELVLCLPISTQDLYFEKLQKLSQHQPRRSGGVKPEILETQHLLIKK